MSLDKIHNIQKPEIKDKKWLIFPHTIFSNLDTMDCDDTYKGQCYKNKTFKQCLKLCENSVDCEYGYYISRKNNDNICVPLKKKQRINPIYRLRDQIIYPELSNAYSQTFLNKKKYPFPPEHANMVFFMDNFLIENTDTSMIINNTTLKNNEKVLCSKDGKTQIQILQINQNSTNDIQFVPVRYGDLVAFNIPNTNLIMKESQKSNNLEWSSRSFGIYDNIFFQIIPGKGKKIGDIINYSDVFNIKSSKINILGVGNSRDILKYNYKNYIENKKKINTSFRFKPKMSGYYCNDNKCVEIPLEKMTVDKDGIGKYKGIALGRNPECFGVCNYKNNLDIKKSNNRKNNIIWLFLLLVPIVIIILLFYNHFTQLDI